MYRELSHPVPAALLPAPASVPAPAPVLAPAPDLCGASTRAECAAVGCLTSLAQHCLQLTARPPRRHHMLRTILALALASSVWSQPGINLPICSHDSTICDGSYSGTQLCAPLHRPPCTMHHPTRGVDACLQGSGERRRGRTEGGPRARIGWWRRVVASRRGEAHRASAARRGSDAPLDPSSRSGAPLAGTFGTRA